MTGSGIMKNLPEPNYEELRRDIARYNQLAGDVPYVQPRNEDISPIDEYVTLFNNPRFQLQETYKANIDLAIKRNKKDFDSIFLFCGKPRSGKSTLSMQTLSYISNMFGKPFNVENVAFSSQQFKEKVDIAEKYSCIQYDEARRGFNITRTMSTINQTLMDTMNEIGYKNLFISIITPRFFDLMSDLALDRSLCLINTVLDSNWNRGVFGFYNEPKKENLWYMKSKQKTTIGAFKSVRPNFWGRFNDFMPIDKVEYEKRKTEFIRDASEEKEGGKGASIAKNRLDTLMYNLKRQRGFTPEEICTLIGKDMSLNAVNVVLSKMKTQFQMNEMVYRMSNTSRKISSVPNELRQLAGLPPKQPPAYRIQKDSNPSEQDEETSDSDV